MRFHRLVLGIALLSLAVAPLALAQAQTPGQVQIQRSGENPIYKITINVVERQTSAVNYRHRGGPTRLDFRGTPLLPKAHGEVEVEGRKGYMEIKAELKDLEPASRFGPEYLTYVLWAITPEGRPVNLGEVLLDENNRGVLHVTTDLQAFGMIVTAEPSCTVEFFTIVKVAVMLPDAWTVKFVTLMWPAGAGLSTISATASVL